ncbi:hypothetical protein BO85DRAFT_441043 [Aspergillus piperis CBS 112811]|uniref:Uncharacterized protein n=1 Tax=Aspergillus piperis CBS 112811 TaxID=1448313 RepID=A0A8G1QXB8_9EURO|nr:hypothetical protein BO85DRAFT_441043 [Aspergillus piperis CBS 112811]RAH54597.1 hypothetical protein BO85DRAFT_441043 [Aspergillus piperis CBS 112811]
MDTPGISGGEDDPSHQSYQRRVSGGRKSQNGATLRNLQATSRGVAEFSVIEEGLGADGNSSDARNTSLKPMICQEAHTAYHWSSMWKTLCSADLFRRLPRFQRGLLAAKPVSNDVSTSEASCGSFLRCHAWDGGGSLSCKDNPGFNIYSQHYTSGFLE